jgi:hypothetical protein
MPSNTEELKLLVLRLQSDLARLANRLDSLTSQMEEYREVSHRAQEAHYTFTEMLHRNEKREYEIREILERGNRIEYELRETREALQAIRGAVENVAEKVRLDEARIDYNIAPVRGFPNPKDRSELRHWWHEILRKHKVYSCFAIFLVLPSDKEAIRYLTEFSRELHLISGENCLVLGMGKTELRYFGFDEQLWRIAIAEQTFEGYSLKVAQLFNIAISDIPCLILFRDIRSPEHLAVSLKGMKAEDIAEQIRALFSIVNKAVVDNEDPLKMIERQRNNEQFRKAGSSVISELRNFAGKTFETAMEATIKAIIK